MEIKSLQRHIGDIYFERDRERGTARTFAWLVEEVGELSKALRGEDRENLNEEFSDVLAWLASLANLVDVDLEEVFSERYGEGCPKCHHAPCGCSSD